MSLYELPLSQEKLLWDIVSEKCGSRVTYAKMELTGDAKLKSNQAATVRLHTTKCFSCECVTSWSGLKSGSPLNL